ncbi:MAG: hypothetical protein ACOYNL_03765 [Rickettsiales bacterium]
MMRSFAIYTVLAIALLISPAPAHWQAQAQTAVTLAPDDEPAKSPSEAELQTVDQSGNQVGCAQQVPEAAGSAIIGTLVPCLVYTIQEATINFTAEMVALIAPIMYSFLLLVVCIYGVRVLQNEPDIYKQGFLLIFKIAIISIVLNDLGDVAAYDGTGGPGMLIESVYGIMNQSQEIIISSIDYSGINCNVAAYKGAQTPQVWATMDCIMGKLFGYELGQDGKINMVLATSLFGLLSGFFFSGTWGATIFFLMLGVLVSVLLLVVRAVVGFISSYLTICFMLVIAPIFFPLALLNVTTSYFEKVWRIILGAFLTPVIITCYVMFALLLYDDVLFAPNSIVQKLFDYDNVKEAMLQDKKLINREIQGDPDDVRSPTGAPTAAENRERYSNPFLQNFITRTMTGSNDAGAASQVTNLDLTKIRGFGGTREEFQKAFTELISLFIIAWLINEGLKTLPDLIRTFVGQSIAMRATQEISTMGGELPTAARDAKLAAKETLGKGGASFSGGAGFLRSMPGNAPKAVSNSMSTFVKSTSTRR